MLRNALTTAGILNGEELAMLSHVFEEVVSGSPLFLGNKPAREELAKQILFQYQAGVVDPERLKSACCGPADACPVSH